MLTFTDLRMPITLMIKNMEYETIRGGGRSSARETANWIVGGAVAKQLIKDIKITAFTSSVGEIFIDKPYQDLDFSTIEQNMVRCADPLIAEKMIEHISEIKKQGDTVGGTITCVIQNVPVGLGEPIFNKLHAALGKLCFQSML